MTESPERVCVGCGDAEEMAHLEMCSMCNRFYCPDCATKGFGRRFCSFECARAWYFAGESDDDDDTAPED